MIHPIHNSYIFLVLRFRVGNMVIWYLQPTLNKIIIFQVDLMVQIKYVLCDFPWSAQHKQYI